MPREQRQTPPILEISAARQRTELVKSELRAALRSRGIGERDLAREFGFAGAYFSNLFDSSRKSSIELKVSRLLQILHAVEIQPSEFFRGLEKLWSEQEDKRKARRVEARRPASEGNAAEASPADFAQLLRTVEPGLSEELIASLRRAGAQAAAAHGSAAEETGPGAPQDLEGS